MLTERTAQELASTGLLADSSAERSLHELATVATRGIPGCTAATVAVWEDTDARETAASHPDLGTLFELERCWGEGPTPQARRTLQPVFVFDTLREHRWPRFARAAIRYGIRATLVLPLEVEHVTITVALHGARPRPWDEGSVLPLTALLAAQVSVVLRNVNAYADAARAASG